MVILWWISSPGCQELNSVRLLQYARVRHNAGDDFGRSERQQEVIRAVRDKVLSLGGVGSLITKAGDLWGTVKNFCSNRYVL